MKRWLVAAMLLVAACSEIGNPTPRTEGALVRTTDSAIGPLVTEVRLIPPERAQALLAELGDRVDHVDPAVPRGGSVVAVIVRPEASGPKPEFVHLVTEFALPGGASERRVWVGRGAFPRFIAIFGLAATPIDVRTSTLAAR